MDDIARVANVAKPTVYRHFGTKEALFGEAIDLTLDLLKSEVAAIAAGAAPPRERLRAIIDVIFQRIGRLKALIRAAEAGALRSGKVGRPAIRRELGGVIARVIGEGIADGGFVATDPDLAAMVVLGGVRMAADSANRVRPAPWPTSCCTGSSLRSPSTPCSSGVPPDAISAPFFGGHRSMRHRRLRRLCPPAGRCVQRRQTGPTHGRQRATGNCHRFRRSRAPGRTWSCAARSAGLSRSRR